MPGSRSQSLSSADVSCANADCPVGNKVGDKDYIVECFGCNGTFHAACAGLTADNYVKFKKTGALETGFSFICPGCRIKLHSLIKGAPAPTVSTDSAGLADLEKRLTAQINCLSERVVQLESKPSLTHAEVSETVRDELEKSSKKDKLVLFGLRESKSGSIEQRRLDDQGQVKEMADMLGVPDGDIQSVFRDGMPRKDGTNRPIKIKFAYKEPRIMFLTKLHTLQKEKAAWEKIWVRPDLSYMERQSDERLRKKLEEIRLRHKDVKIRNGGFVIKIDDKHVPFIDDIDT